MIRHLVVQKVQPFGIGGGGKHSRGLMPGPAERFSKWSINDQVERSECSVNWRGVQCLCPGGVKGRSPRKLHGF